MNGYFFKNIKINDTELPVYNNEKLYATPEDLVEAILEKAKQKNNQVNEKEYKSIQKDIMSKVKKCKDALSVCDTIKKCLDNYEETDTMFLDISYTSVFN